MLLAGDVTVLGCSAVVEVPVLEALVGASQANSSLN